MIVGILNMTTHNKVHLTLAIIRPRSKIVNITGNVVSLAKTPIPTAPAIRKDTGLFNLLCRRQYDHMIKSAKNVPPASSITEQKKSNVGGLVANINAAAKPDCLDAVIRTVMLYMSKLLKSHKMEFKTP